MLAVERPRPSRAVENSRRRPQIADHPHEALAAFARAVRELRLERGLTIDDLAEPAGLTSGEIGRIERAEREAGVTTVVRVARALDVEVGELFAPRHDRDLTDG